MMAGFGSYAPDVENNSVENNNQHNHEGRQHYNNPEITTTGRRSEDEGSMIPEDDVRSFGTKLFHFSMYEWILVGENVRVDGRTRPGAVDCCLNLFYTYERDI